MALPVGGTAPLSAPFFSGTVPHKIDKMWFVCWFPLPKKLTKDGLFVGFRAKE